MTAKTGRMIAHIVWNWAEDCSRFVVLQRQRSCLQNCCASDWQRVFECRQNTVVWHYVSYANRAKFCQTAEIRPHSAGRSTVCASL